jgi:hypothetical protein
LGRRETEDERTRNGPGLVIRGLRVLLATAHFGLAVIAALVLTYFLGHVILDGPVQGSDSLLHLSYITWLDRYFPSIPNWYPIQGAGESLLHGYPILAHLTVVVLHRVTGETILRTFRIVTFLTFPLTALGIYVFCWSVFKRQTIGLIAAVLYLLAPVSWTWMVNWGFFPQQTAFVFLPLILTAYERTLRHQVNRVPGGRGRLWFVLLIILLVTGSLTHMMVGAAAAIGIALLTCFAVLTAPPEDRQAVFRGGMKIILLLALVGGLVVAAYLIPFYRYGRVANREGLNTPPVEQLHRLPIPEFFGLKAIDPLEVLTRMQFPFAFVGFAILGIVFAALLVRAKQAEAKRALPIGLSLVVSTLVTLSPAIVAVFLRLTPFVYPFVSFRSALLLTTVLMPVVAAYGIWTVAWMLLHPRSLLARVRTDHGEMGAGFKALGDFGSSLVSILIVLACFVPGGSFATNKAGALSYGPTAIDLVDIWGTEEVGNERPLVEQLAPNSWPSLAVLDEDLTISRSIELGSVLPQDRPLRIDVSPYQGRLAMDLAAYSDLSQINSYGFQLDLTHAMWGYQQNVFYSREDPVNEYGNPRTLNGLANWFGTKYVYLRPDQDPVETYKAAGWEKTYEDSTLEVWHDPSAPEMATATTRPAVLVIGTPESDSYMTVFRLANDGMLPYDQAILVEGRSNVDSYSVEELSEFDAVFLYGYDYKDGRRAWNTLASYVKQGGSLFVDTGWEFWIPEWEFETAPDVLPVDRLTWTDYGPATSYELGAPEISGDIDVTKFKPLIWEGRPWTLSGAEASEVKDWGRVVLSSGGRPLIVAGDYGEGRVVWSGMNLIGHARYGDPSPEEIRLLGNLVRWLSRVGSGADLPTPITARPDPDHVDLTFTTAPGDVTWLYWRESYYPDWHAYVSDATGEHEVPIYRGGPGLMLMPVRSDSPVASIRLVWVPSWTEQGAIILSTVGVLLLAAFFVDGLFLDGNGFTWLRIAMTMRMPSPILDEEANLEMAEAQKAELEGRRKGLHFGRGHATRSGHHARKEPQAMSVTFGQSSEAAPPTGETALEDKLDGDQQALLQSWLESTEHADDAWASRLIGRNRGNS